MIGHSEMMLSSIAERLNVVATGMQHTCRQAMDHAGRVDPPACKSRQEHDWDRAIAQMERALADAREVAAAMRQGRERQHPHHFPEAAE